MFKHLLNNKVRKEQVIEKVKVEAQRKKFKGILEFAQSVLENSDRTSTYKQYYSKGNEHPLLDVVRLIGKNAQTKYLTSLLYCDDETELPSLFPGDLFFDQTIYVTNDGKKMYHLKEEVKNTKEIKLNKDLILPWPWKRERLINSISYIGEQRSWGEWEQDNTNHYVELWLPLGIVWVRGGNHSIATGILQGVGTIKPDSTYDMKELYNHIYTDGISYFRKSDDSIIAAVEDVEFAAIFEIGRLMINMSISF
ncbi:DUF6710 family protein [Paenibacillus sp. WC2504]|uniref:DUF6710 family protein n=1 Tax=Paenibacillus sp. WC2504 TaxID=3461403 RepID=UPI0040454B09